MQHLSQVDHVITSSDTFRSMRGIQSFSRDLETLELILWQSIMPSKVFTIKGDLIHQSDPNIVYYRDSHFSRDGHLLPEPES